MGTLSAADDVALRVVSTISTDHPDAVDETAFDSCTGDYLCECETCRLERACRVRNGVRSFPAIPIRRAA